MSLLLYIFSTTVVQFEKSKEQQMTLTKRHGVQRQVPVKLQPPRYQRHAVKTSHRTTIKMHRLRVMPP